MIFAFMAEYASGKDYFCDHLVKTQGAIRLSFSDEVRRLATQIFPWLPFDISPEQKDKPFRHESNPHGLSPRQIWLTVGKVRDVDPHYFVGQFVKTHDWILYNDSTRKDSLYIITDFRTPQEWEFIRAMRIPVIKIEREDRTGLIPSDFEEYVRNFTGYNYSFINRMNGVEEFDDYFKQIKEAHASDLSYTR